VEASRAPHANLMRAAPLYANSYQRATSASKLRGSTYTAGGWSNASSSALGLDPAAG